MFINIMTKSKRVQRNYNQVRTRLRPRSRARSRVRLRPRSRARARSRARSRVRLRPRSSSSSRARASKRIRKNLRGGSTYILNDILKEEKEISYENLAIKLSNDQNLSGLKNVCLQLQIEIDKISAFIGKFEKVKGRAIAKETLVKVSLNKLSEEHPNEILILKKILETHDIHFLSNFVKKVKDDAYDSNDNM